MGITRPAGHGATRPARERADKGTRPARERADKGTRPARERADKAPQAEPASTAEGRPWLAHPTVRRWGRRTVFAGLLGVALAVTASAGATGWLRNGADGHLYAELDVPAAPMALVLGTRVYPDGTPSEFLAARLELARRLHSAGKVRTILVSGAARPADDYDEPAAMRRWLVERGVPADQIIADRAGFDTYDSCARAQRVYEVEQAIVVTQSFHLPRAVTLCRRLGIDAVGVGDESVRIHERTWSVSSTREYGAAVKAVLDLLSGRDPRVL